MIFPVDNFLDCLNINPMNKTDREAKLNFIFETGKRLRFYMDETVMREGLPQGCSCSELTAIQMRAAAVVSMHQPLSLNELAERLGVSPPSASVMVDRLVEKNVLSREADGQDRRRVVLRIHPEATPAMEAMHKGFQAAFDRIARKVGDENVLRWHEVMKQVSALLAEEKS